MINPSQKLLHRNYLVEQYQDGYILIDKYENQIGKVTSGTLSPYLEKAIGLGYVKSDFSSPLTEIGVVIRGKVWTAKIVKTPFI